MNFSKGSSSPSALDWRLSQVFGEPIPGEVIQQIDVITAIEFDKSGDYLAVGDRGGRVVIFEKTSGKDHPDYQYKTEFQSHEPEFDCLKSLEIEETINNVSWCGNPNESQFILAANSKTIKLWKVKERKVKKVKEAELNPFVYSENTLLSEKSFAINHREQSLANGVMEGREKITNLMPPSHEEPTGLPHVGDAALARCRKVYAHAHDFNINSISNNSDGETFVSADDLRINLWNFEVSDQCFNIIDMSPPSMEDLTEVITSAEFHPLHCNMLAYSSSRGFIRLVDMRQSALCDHNAKILNAGESRGCKSFFNEIIASISDIKFATNGMHILSRDYMNLKLWDLRMETSPVATYKIHEYLRPKLCDLYNNDAIFDKFDCCLSGDGLHFASGSYSNLLRIFSFGPGSEDGITIEASKSANRKLHHQAAPRMRRSSFSNLTRGFQRQVSGRDNSSSGSEGPCNLNAKLLHLAWHPRTSLIACAAGNSLFMYYA